jgi:predicted RNA-binding protein
MDPRPMSKTYWMLVMDQENFEITRDHGFTVQGVDTRNRRKAVRMTPEDRIIFYIRDRRGFAATATVASDHFEEHSRIWKHHRPEEDFPNRVEITPDSVLEEEDYLDARDIAPTLEYVKKWPPERWDLAFFGMLHIIPQRDFNLLEEEMKKVEAAEKARAPKEEEHERPETVSSPLSAAAAHRRRLKRKEQTARRRRKTRARVSGK